ncbi:C40 family peptidase [Micromonospora sp. DR5-3]|uniref:C40 family peptidase n=1 Tax=unclassified Micromonospora TaxID=2617518 RepID=UPI0016521C3E|nr:MULTISPECIES: C40 family peptidase [unclassified Micromonospora]MCW3816461.1 C40 family peptidase [Micromonospora sp. DR5-3]
METILTADAGAARRSRTPVIDLLNRAGFSSAVKLFVAFLLIAGTIGGVSSLASAASSSCDGSLGERAVCFAAERVGDRYVWGGHKPSGFDCSGLTYWAYRKAGFSWSRTTAQGQYDYGKDRHLTVSTKELRPGDLIFFNWDGGEIDHVGIYAGNNKMIHASSGAGMVKKVALNNYYRAYMKSRAVRPSLARANSPTGRDKNEDNRHRPEPTTSPSDSQSTDQPVLVVIGDSTAVGLR